MSTSDQNEGAPLTRKQLRELRLTGSTPTAPEKPVAPADPVEQRAAEPVSAPPAPTPDSAVDLGETPLTRRQAREQERIRTASVPVITPPGREGPGETQIPVGAAAAAASGVHAAQQASPPPHAVREPEVVTAVPSFVPVGETPAGEEQAVAEGSAEVAEPAEDESDAPAAAEGAVEDVEADAVAEVFATSDEESAEEERPQLNPAFGSSVAATVSTTPEFTPSFDDLVVGDSTGSQHSAPSALIFTQGPTEASLSGPVASTGEILVTGSYELPRGIGSQGHAAGTDGKEIDAVLVDGELPATSSPTPIAASSAVSTLKPAGEVIRPPAPEKSNRLMLTLAIVAGGLAIVLAAALILAFATNVLP